MDAAGLRRIMDTCREFGYPQIDTQLDLIEKLIDADEKALRELVDQEILRDYTNPQDVYNAIMAKTQGTRAYEHFLSAMQHLLLIREEGPTLVHYYQMIDSVVTDIALDKKLGGSESRLGTSVQRIIAQLNDADRFQYVEDQAAEARSMALRLKLEKEVLEEEVSKGSDGLVGRLKEKIAHLEEKLKSLRHTTENLQGRLEEQKRGYEEQISQLEMQIMELFRMLKELGRGVDHIVEQGGGMDRKTLLETLQRQLERDNTISILEGRHNPKRRKTRVEGDHQGGDTEEEMTSGVAESSSLKRHKNSGAKGRTKSGRLSESQKARASQFMDADEASVQEHIEQRLAAGVELVRFP